MRAVATGLILSTALAGTAFAEEIKIKPGMWETETKITMSFVMNGQPLSVPGQTHSDKSCKKADDAKFDPADLAQEDCTASDIKATDTTLSFKMVCSTQGGDVSGTFDFKLNDARDAGTGDMKMTGSAGGGTMTLVGKTTAKRVSDC